MTVHSDKKSSSTEELPINTQKHWVIEGCLLVGGSLIFLASCLNFKDESLFLPIYYISSAAFYMFCGKFLYYHFKPAELEDSIRSDLIRGEAGEYHFIGLPIAITFFFIMASHYGAKIWPGEFMYIAGDWHLYILDNVIRAIFFDFAEIFGIKISYTEHAYNLWPSILVFTFRTTISLALVSVVLRSIKIINRATLSE